MTHKDWLHEASAFQEISGILVDKDFEITQKASTDFGNLTKGNPRGVAFPKTTADVACVLNFANTHNLGCSVRGGGYSQGGQTLALPGDITLDCSQMTNISPLDFSNNTLTCQPGVTWAQAVEAAAPHGFLPKVMPFFPNLTIGGVISIGGIGGNSHLHGSVNAQVKELEVVKGTGEITSCSKIKEPNLFEATLGGLGRCSFISTATLDLRTFKRQIVTYYLVYDDHTSWFSDIKRLREEHHCDYLEGFCTPSFQGLHKHQEKWMPLPFWLYNSQVSFEYEEEEDLNDHQHLLNTLSHSRVVHTQHSKTLDFVGRYGARAKSMKANGLWETPHPWFEFMLPLDVLTKNLPELLNRLPLSLGDGLGYRLFHINELTPTSFMLPDLREPTVGFAILPTNILPLNMQETLDNLEVIHEWIIALGGKRCLAGWLGSNTKEFWNEHYGHYYDRWKNFKQQYDPKGVLRSVLLN
jgi:cytokinin dehydrogenase